jgi:hypothetical protein
MLVSPVLLISPAGFADVRAADSMTMQEAPVGAVSLVLGRAWVDGPGQARREIRAGTVIHATDRIQTESNGHVHIRFIDQALVSVRPDSRLEIVRYEYNADQPQLSTIKLQLDEGVTRSISGRGASAARERFRLNTPIAAIGVRGTDFVVNATQTSVRALVNEGAIVLAPFSADCLAIAFGPCSSNALELTDSSFQVIEFDGTSTAPRLVPEPEQRDANMIAGDVEVTASSIDEAVTEGSAPSSSVQAENKTSSRVTEEVANSIVPVTPPEPDFTPKTAIASAALESRQLIWGRYTNGMAERERITAAFDVAQAGRDVAVSGGGYLLYRDGGGSTRVDRGLGPVSFALDSAQAFYDNGSGAVAMVVSDGSLDINFDNSTFVTGLNMKHALTGDVSFNATGAISDAGYFFTRSATERLNGAVSLDGSEAAYFFEQQLESGGIKGLTLWDKR